MYLIISLIVLLIMINSIQVDKAIRLVFNIVLLICLLSAILSIYVYSINAMHGQSQCSTRILGRGPPLEDASYIDDTPPASGTPLSVWESPLDDTTSRCEVSTGSRRPPIRVITGSGREVCLSNHAASIFRTRNGAVVVLRGIDRSSVSTPVLLEGTRLPGEVIEHLPS